MAPLSVGEIAKLDNCTDPGQLRFSFSENPVYQDLGYLMLLLGGNPDANARSVAFLPRGEISA